MSTVSPLSLGHSFLDSAIIILEHARAAARAGNDRKSAVLMASASTWAAAACRCDPVFINNLPEELRPVDVTKWPGAKLPGGFSALRKITLNDLGG